MGSIVVTANIAGTFTASPTGRTLQVETIREPKLKGAWSQCLKLKHFKLFTNFVANSTCDSTHRMRRVRHRGMPMVERHGYHHLPRRSRFEGHHQRRIHVVVRRCRLTTTCPRLDPKP